MDLSIIVPAFNNQKKLNNTLKKLNKYRYLIKEVIVVDDGSKPPLKVPKKVKLIRQKNGGAAKARNTGAKNAKGDILMFIGDDILLTEEVILEHFANHEATYNVAVTSPQKYTENNAFTRFLVDKERDASLKGSFVEPREFCTACASIKTEHFIPFDETFKHASLEDTEMALRLENTMFWLGTQTVTHDHHWTEESFKKRQRLYGKYYERLFKKPKLISLKAASYKKLSKT